MLVVVDGDARGALCSRLRGMGHTVLEPPCYANRGGEAGEAMSEFHVCLVAAWYLIVGRRASSGTGLFVNSVFVAGGPRTIGISAPVRVCWRSRQYEMAYARLQKKLSAEFCADAYVLVSMPAKDRACEMALPLELARSMNTRYWTLYRRLRLSGVRTFVI